MSEANAVCDADTETYTWEQMIAQGNDLTDKIKKNLFDDFWHEGVYDCAKEDGLNYGFEINDIAFSGFWSQGDGASWEGQVNIPKWLTQDRHYKDRPETQILLELLADLYMHNMLPITRSDRPNYVHEMTMQGGEITHYIQLAEGMEPDRMTRGIFAGSDVLPLFNGIGGEVFLVQVETDILESARDYARDIYKQLEAEYDYQQSDEYIADMCASNQYRFTKGGELV